MIKTLNAIIVLLLALVILLVSSFAFTDPHVYLLLEQLDGLEAEDEITFKGMPVGYVEDVNLFEESPNQQTYFVATLIIEKDKFKHLYREMEFKVESVSLLSPQKQLVIDDANAIKLNKLQRNEYIFGHSDDLEFVSRAIEVLKEIERDTKPLRQNIGTNVKNRIQTFIRQMNQNAQDTTST